MSKRLVVVTYHFGPAGPVGGLRWWALTKNLARAGWECHVISATDVTRQAGQSEAAPEGVTHHFLAPGRTLGDVYKGFRQRNSGDGASSKPRAETERPEQESDPMDDVAPPPARGIAALRGELAALVSFPDEGRGWLAKATRMARRVVHDVKPDVVVSSGPPHSVHAATWAALRGHRDVRWLMDLRDPWGEQDLGSPNVTPTLRRSNWLRRTTNWLEERTLAASSGFITTTPELAEALAERHPPAISYCLTNGVDEDWLPERAGEPFPGFSIAHVGTLYAHRDPRPLLRAFRRFLDAEPSRWSDGSGVRFAGSMEPPYRRMLDLVVAELGLEDQVEMLGVISREAALDVLKRSSVAVVLTQEQLMQIPAKLYEPVAMRVPTLVLATRNSATASAARRLGVSHADPDDVDQITRCLHAFHRGEAGGVTPELARRIHYGVLVRDAQRILTHDPEREERPAPPEWIRR